jgi:hypothetical protein
MLAAVRPARRAAGLMLAMLGLGLGAWLFTTHLQARFLVPLMIPACVLVGMSLGWGRGGRGLAVRGWIAAALAAWQAGLLVATFARQREFGPNAATVAGPPLFTGEFLIEPRELPAATIARALPEKSRVLLVGDAAAFYLAGAWGAGGPEAVWHTTWDASPLGDAIRETGGQGPEAWAAWLKGRGFTHVLFNFTELTRYQRAGWYDPEVTRERVIALVEWLGEPMMAWDRPRQWLMALPDSRDGGAGG